MLPPTRKAIAPFWNRIPRFFLYPLYPSGAVVLTGVLVLMAVLPLSLIGMLLRLVVLLFFNKYCFEVLAQTAEGRLRPPALDLELLTQGYEMPFKQFGVFITLSAASYGVTAALGAWAGALFGLLTNLALPAILMVLAVSGSLLTALAPHTVGGLIWRIGWPYLILVAFLVLLTGGMAAVPVLLGEVLSPQALIAVAALAMLYGSVIIFNMMGYVVYQYHDALGLHATEDDDADPAFADFQRFMAEQNYPAALEELRNLLPARWEDLELHRRLHKLAALIGNTDVLLRHAREFIPLLRERGRIREAMDIFRTCVGVEPSFRPNRAEDYLPIAQMLRESRQPRLAIALINGFHKRFPDSPETPALYLLAARLFHEELGDAAQAIRILRYTLGAFPDHALCEPIKRYLNVLKATSPASAGDPA